MLRTRWAALLLGGIFASAGGCNAVSGTSDLRVTHVDRIELEVDASSDAPSSSDGRSVSDAGPVDEDDASDSDASIEAGDGCTTTAFTHGTLASAWDNPSNALAAADGQSATTAFYVKNVASSLLKVSGFGFVVPSTARITGVAVKVVRSGNTHYLKDGTVTLLGSGRSAIGENRASGATEWPPALEQAVYGGAKDGWGAGLTPEIVGSADFGFAISCGFFTLNGVPRTPVASVDEIAVAITYCE